MATVNERLRDATIDHQVDLTQYSNNVVRRMIALLNRIDSDLFGALINALQDMTAESFTVQRLEQLLGSVRMLNAAAYQQINAELTTELRDFVGYESGYQYKLFKSAIPAQIVAQVDIASVSAEMIYSAAMSRPFQGVLLREALTGLGETRQKLIRDTIRIGYSESKTTSEIVRQIRGTRANNYADGLMEKPRQHVEAVVRTALSHTASFTRDRFFEANKDLLSAVQWLSTIDLRTSEICRIRDQRKYTADEAHKPIGHSYPWLSGPGNAHWCCRSTSTPVVKSWKELGGADIPGFSPASRASLDGQVAADTNYPDWLKRQSAGRQDQVLGPIRGKLLRDGGLELKDMYGSKGKYLTLAELREKDAEAFRKAGL